MVLIDHWRDQGITCLCGQLLNSDHVDCNASFGRKVGIEIRQCSYDEQLSYKIKQDCVSCMETKYCMCGKRLSHTNNCLLCNRPREYIKKKIDCRCFCRNCLLGNHKCTCCKTCNEEITYCLMHNHCRTLQEVQESMGI